MIEATRLPPVKTGMVYKTNWNETRKESFEYFCMIVIFLRFVFLVYNMCQILYHMSEILSEKEERQKEKKIQQ